jgi:predicted RNA methylase
VALEQYPTSAHLTAAVICLAFDKGDLGPGMSCLDLGCGTGMLSIAAAFVCDVVIAVDCDEDALELARENAEQVDLEDTIQFINARVEMKSSGNSNNNNNKKQQKQGRGGGSGRNSKRGGGRGSASQQQTKALIIMDDKDGIPLRSNCVDTVLTNPPFGTKNNQGIDVQFLRTATRLARRAVYSFHKRSTRAYLIKTVQEWGYEVQVAAEMKFDIPQMYKFHEQKSIDVEVDLLRISIPPDVPDPERPLAQPSASEHREENSSEEEEDEN